MTAPVDVYRPYQYLGSKLRAIETILRVADSIGVQGTVADLFTGTGVVAQAFANSGRRVIAADAMQFPCVVAGALLGVGSENQRIGLEDAAARIAADAHEAQWWSDWDTWVASEREALAHRDCDALSELYETLPLAWRPAKLGGEPSPLKLIHRLEGIVPREPMPLMTAYYAGTYFGVEQALHLDALRAEIWRSSCEGKISAWQSECMVTALVGAASDAVFSAGKHFAQPLGIRGGHASKRVFIDRGVDVPASFLGRVSEVLRVARPATERHVVARKSIEEWVASPEALFGVSAIYADPPYTAQQYSRFYHVPETLVSRRVPTMQLVGGSLTKGLYPDDRHFSRFSRKGTAPDAFRDLIGLSQTLGAGLLLSYSEPGVGSGNARMMDLDSICSLIREIRPSCEIRVETLDHQYRQFNSQRAAMRDQSGSEYLLAVL